MLKRAPDLLKDWNIIWNYNQSQKLLRLTIFSWKSPKLMLDLLKDTQNSPSPLVQYCAKLGKTMPGSGGQE